MSLSSKRGSSLPGELPTPSSHSPRPPPSPFQLIKQSQPIQLLLLALVLITGYLFWPSPTSPLSPLARAALSHPAWPQAHLDRASPGPAGRPPSANGGKAVDSWSNPYGLSGLIDAGVEKAFNPSVLVLPDGVGERWRRLAVVRGKQEFEVKDGEEVFWSTVYATFPHETTSNPMLLPSLSPLPSSAPLRLPLPATATADYTRCHESFHAKFVGPEDPRLFLTSDGQPLMIYSQTGHVPNVCRALFVVDVRAVVPGLGEAMAAAGWGAEVVFGEQVALVREGQGNVEKNWAPFEGENDELFLHANLIPQEIYKYVPGDAPLQPVNPNPPQHNCLTELTRAQRDHAKFHHATPLLRATLCRRGECTPDIHNTVLFGIIHIKYMKPRMFYERRVVTWNVTAPYEYISVSKPIHFTGTNQADAIYTVSMSWDHPTNRNGLGLNHGYLDEVLVTTFGIKDDEGGYTDLLARDLLTDHAMCEGMGNPGLW